MIMFYGFLFLRNVLKFFELLLENHDLTILFNIVELYPIKECVNNKFIKFLYQYLNVQFAEYIYKDKEVYLLKENYIYYVHFL